MRFSGYTFVFGITLLLATSRSFAGLAVREERLLLPIQVGSNFEQLEALIVHPAGEGKFPVALIVNGSAGRHSPQDMHADWLAHLAHDFANRGWLAASVVWPGYGNSTGKFVNKAGSCSKPDVADFIDAHADELAAALKALQARADVNPSIALGVGISIGGASMLDLAGRPDRPLTAVINISGGVYHSTKPGIASPQCSLFEGDLVREVGRFGHSNATPTLWLYAANDPFFYPELARRMLDGYRSNGGVADFTLFPPFGTNGHTLYRREASSLISPKIDSFLRDNHLPAFNENTF